eukprot:c23042_g2_i1 orf=638-1942(+)
MDLHHCISPGLSCLDARLSSSYLGQRDTAVPISSLGYLKSKILRNQHCFSVAANHSQGESTWPFVPASKIAPVLASRVRPTNAFSDKQSQVNVDEQAMQMQIVKDDLAIEPILKDLSTLTRPLSLTDLPPQPAYGSRLRVAYQGVPGAYSEAAASRAYPNCEAVPCEQFEVAFQAVELWVVDRAVLPIENSLGGSIHRNYDLLLRHRLHIVGEVQLAVHHCLLGLPGVKKEDLRRVVSHPQALAQCENTLSKLGVIREAVDDTAGAAQFIAENNLQDTGAVASARAAEIYGLDILADGIQDDSDNVTRFLMLAREPIIPRVDKPFKTSITFTLEEGPGVLFKALAVFALREINLTKIESRPLRKQPLRIVDDSNNGTAKSVYFDYLFFVDFEASMADFRSQNALGHLQEFATFLKVLGSYPMDVTPMKNFQSEK